MKTVKSKSSANKKGGSQAVWNEHNVGKALDVAKQGTTTISSVANVFSEVQKTKQKKIDAEASIAKSEHKTKRALANMTVSLAEVHRDMEKNKQEHEAKMTELNLQHELNVTVAEHRERLLDKLLEAPASDSPALVDGLRNLLPGSN